MPTASALLDAYQQAFDDTRANGLVFLNERYRRMVVEARWLTTEATLTTTVADQDAYQVTAGIENIQRVEIGGVNYYPVGLDDFRSLSDTTAGTYVDDGRRVFAEDYSSTAGDFYIRLYPAPDTTGDAITVISSGQPTALTDATTSAGTPKIPDDLQSYLRDGLWADGYTFVDKNTANAQVHEQRYLEGIERLRRRRRSRTSHVRRVGVAVGGRY